MSPNSSDDNYVRAEDRIYQVATDKDRLDWRSFLHELINKEGLDPWDVDLSILTRKYIEAVKGIPNVDFDISGKFLTIAVFLLKVKAENYIDRDLRGMEEKIARVQNTDDENIFDEVDSLEDFDNHLEDVKRKKEKYSIKVRNPIARKRKVNIFDLINALEKTFEQSNKRKANFFARNRDVEYEGPMYEKKPMDLKEIIDELYGIIMNEFSDKEGHILFHHLTSKKDDKKGILSKFIPLLHLHNQEKVLVKQKEHFGHIEIHKVNKDKKSK